jgi:hypothetical protein
VGFDGDIDHAVGGAGFAGIFDDFLEGDAEAGGIGPEGREAGLAGYVDLDAAFRVKLEGRKKREEKVRGCDLAPLGGGGGGEGLGAVHELGGGLGAFADSTEAGEGIAIEFLVVDQQAEVAVEKAQDVVHLVREAPDKMIVKFRLLDTHGLPN